VLNLNIGSGQNVDTRVDQGENQGSGRAGTERLRGRQHLSTGGNKQRRSGMGKISSQHGHPTPNRMNIY
jgi:hypothetical protein